MVLEPEWTKAERTLNFSPMRYRDHPSWQTYRRILRERFGLAIDHEPTERRRTLRGHDLHVDEWDARIATEAQGMLILVHGGGGNGRVLAPFADRIATMGWNVIAPDLPGFGLTRPAPDWKGDYAEWPAIIAALASEVEGPVVLMGLSMGGLTAAYAAAQAPDVAGVIATTLLDLSDPGTFVRAARNRALGVVSLASARAMPFVMDRLSLPLDLAAPLHLMSADPEMTRYFRTDPLLGRRWVPLRFWRTAHRYRSAPTLPCELLLVHPGADEWTPPEASCPTFERITGPKLWRLLDHGSHLPVEPEAFGPMMDEVGAFMRVRGRATNDIALA